MNGNHFGAGARSGQDRYGRSGYSPSGEEGGRNDGPLAPVKVEINNTFKNEKRCPADIRVDKWIQWAEVIGRNTRSVKVSQIRKVFGLLVRIENDVRANKTFSNEPVIYLKAHLAYAVGRNRQNQLKDLYEILVPVIDRVRDGEDGLKDFENLMKFFRSILAYHRFYGGRE
ncbi:MAG: type III-A CRISPR-associated protein Csm2 [Candidatus Reconcilbacillus cellulovorans]|mgnify:FL=1|uniref:CRISPR system Cms protein Csm2 n=1 Tax=Candidatus Reconcilbacillus cellulovorans TaxID=1906605 RepID=A0A2A6DXT2_9BACL|nr:MAG: type III-A CRISPR-associated protein Csm2 [Candidatus Reconcilbacillus cellulovorans]